MGQKCEKMGGRCPSLIRKTGTWSAGIEIRQVHSQVVFQLFV